MLLILGLAGLLATTPAPVPVPAPQPALQHCATARDLAISIALEDGDGQRVWQALQMQALAQVLRDEARREAEALVADGLVPPDGPPWPQIVARIHDPERLGAMFRDSLDRAAARIAPDLLDRALRFYETGQGGRMVALENAARRAMLDPQAEEAARWAFARADRLGLPRAALIRRLIDEADLVAPNVATGMNASVAFSQGFAEGGGFDMAPTPDQMLAEAWAQQDEIAYEAEAWMQAFLMLAYAPLSDAEIETYIGFATSPEGQALADLMFAGFDAVFVQTSREMGLAAARRSPESRL